jgi:predicted O-linked N-acetylglucosamine transferase (SPINDLY family)
MTGAKRSAVPSVPSQLEKALRLHRSGQLVEAAMLYREFLRKKPNHPDALNLLGLVRQQTGEHVLALECFAKAAAVVPGNAGILLNRGMSLRALGRSEEAMADFNQALALDPSQAEAHHQLGNVLKSLNRHADAVTSLRRASVLAPKNAAIWLNLGVALLALSSCEEAIACFRKAIAFEPGRAEAHNILGSALLDVGRSSEARRQLEEALRLKPAYPAAHDNLGRVLRAQGLAAEALAEFRTALAAQASPGTHSNLVYALNFVPGLPPAGIFAEHKHWAKIQAGLFENATPARVDEPDPARRLRIGYVSPDFIHHAVSYFIEPVLAAHNRSQVEVFCYSSAPVPDAVTARLRAHSDQWRDIARLDDERTAALIREDRIDILIDLAGHTANHRLLVFARKPAPVQVTWLGYPNTTGLDAIGYRITDAICDPPGRTDAFHSEKLVRLPAAFSCYRPPDDAPPVGPLPALKSGYITFGCFNHFAKINPPVLELWARLLARLPASRLLLKARSLADPETSARVRETFTRHGVALDRLELRSDELSVAAHLSLYHDVDIALDPFPYNGTTTTCEALWMGVPVVALAGQTHVSRVSASLLTHLGRQEWIAHSEDDYIEKCAELAADLPRLAELRAGQRERMRCSPVCDAVRFTAQLEDAFREMWRQGCQRKGSTAP